MSRIFSKTNSSPSLPLPTPKSPVLSQRPTGGPMIGMTKVNSYKGKPSPPLSPSGSPVISRRTTPQPPPSSSSSLSSKSIPVFGSSLSVLISNDSEENDEQIIPFLVEECIVYLNRDDVLKNEGLFRQSGKSTDIQDMKRSYDAGKYITLFNASDPHVVTGLLKLYLRSLPEPLIPFSSYEQFISYQKSSRGEMDKFRQLIDDLPLQNKILLKFLCLLLKRAASFEKQSKMNFNSLSIVIGPNIMRAEKEEMMKAMEESPLINFLTATMIEQADVLFNSPALAFYDLNFFVLKRKQRPPVYPSFEDFQEKLEERKKTRNILLAFFQRRPRQEDLVKRKILNKNDLQ